MQLKIGIIGTRGIPNQYGGFEQFAQYLSLGLVAKKHEVIVYNSHLHPYKEKEWKGVQLVHCKDWENKIGTAGQFIYDFNCLRDARKRNFDVLLHLGYTSDSIWHRQWSNNCRHLVNMDGLEWKRSKYNRLTQQFLKKAEAMAVKYADQLIADSTGIQQYLLTKYGKAATFIPYGANLFTTPDPVLLHQLQLEPRQYCLLVARMEPENNIELIIRSYLAAGKSAPLVVVGGVTNKYGKWLLKKYSSPSIRFIGTIYDQDMLNNLRYFSSIYFHGHSVGGTNPSLLEAMACGCHIVAHDNIYNRSVLNEDAAYFLNEEQLILILQSGINSELLQLRKEANYRKIETNYNWEKIVNAYEGLMLGTIGMR